MSDLSENESLKLTATWLNSMSVAIVGTGIILPTINQFLGSNPMDGLILTILICCCLMTAGILHLAGLAVLRGLE